MHWHLWNFDKLLEPLLFYSLAAAGCGLCLYLFLTLKAEIRSLIFRYKENSEKIGDLVSVFEEAHSRLENLEKDLREMEQQTGMLVAPMTTKSGMNLTRRTQVLRMHRSGEQSAGIASSLGLPRGEVELLIKVHRLALDRM
ncbi:MAG: hypothetical protein U0Q18_14105 [Bryobacteraceae bacterium]